MNTKNLRNTILLLLVLILAACSGGADPARTVEQYMQAKAKADRETVQKLLCSAMEADLDMESLSFEGLDAKLEDMACKRDDGADTVTCTGAIVADYGGEVQRFPLGRYSVVQENNEWKWCGEAE